MKKQSILKTLLILFPVLAVGLATTVDSVTVFDTQSGVTEYGSYFTLLPVGGMQMLPPLAGLLCVCSAFCAIAAIVLKKQGLYKSVKWIAFCACLAAVLPVIMRGDVIMVPNVGVPIFMAGEWAVGYFLTEKTALPKNQK